MTTREKAKAAAIRRGKFASFVFEHKEITTAIGILADRIHALGEAGEELALPGHAMCPEAIGGEAAVSLQGTLALLRDLRRATRLPAGKRGRR